MSYAIIRNDKLTRVDAQGSYIHNDRRSKGHSNKDIDPTRTHLNFWCKKNEVTYIKEFDKMKNHAGYTYLMLSQVDGFEDIRDWAAFHHEKLNGKGYPFGKTADELNEPERIMACIDIYQALTEDRPYKKGLSHEKTCEMLDDMAQKGFVDSDISKKIRECFGGI